MKKNTWIIILAASAVLLLVMGLRQSFGLFLKPITESLVIGREVYALALGLMNLLWGLGSPIAGAIADRYGAVKVAMLGGIFYALGLAVMATSQDGTQLLAAGILLGIGLSGAGFSVLLGVVGRAAPAEKRSQMLGIVALGGSVGQFAAIPYAAALLATFDWTVALMIIAGTSVLILPLALGLKSNKSSSEIDYSHNKQTVKEAFVEATRHLSFLFLTAGFFVCGFHLAFIMVHLPAYLEDNGFEPWLAATALILIGLFNMIGTYVSGLLGGKFLKKNVLSLIYVARAAVFLFFLLMPLTEISVMIFAASMGLLWLGTVPLTSGLVAQIFGPTYMSMLYGIVFFSHQLGGFIGPWLAGRLYDQFGSYDAMWILGVVLGLLAALLHLPIVEKPVARLESAAIST
jgi:predicted MFS family arabinose efflux permease